jgi:hypothetical protein
VAGVSIATADPAGVPVDPTPLDLTPLDAAILHAVAFADVFDHAPTPDEIHRHLTIAAPVTAVERRLGKSAALAERLGRPDGFVVAVGREALVERRVRRTRVSAALWPHARLLGRLIGLLPYVRMVAVTGSLAVDAAGGDADVDLFVIVADGRLWLARALVVAVVRLAAPAGIRLCPNYLLAEGAIELDEAERTYGTAREIAQMVPLAGFSTYRRFLARNDWYVAFQPNHLPAGTRRADGGRGLLRRTVERIGRASPLDRLERWEMRRKVRRLRAATRSPEARYDARRCKGHVEGHAGRTAATVEARFRELLGDPRR